MNTNEAVQTPEMHSRFRRERAKRRLAWIAVLIVLSAGGYWLVHRLFPVSPSDFASAGNSIENFAVHEIAKNFAAPPPLRAPASLAPKNTRLTRAGVVADTNAQRKANGDLPALSENATLDSIATLRLDDMFEKQYFAHVAPDGGSAETVAKTVGYDYIAIGENLALGNFNGDNGVVTAWMGSPGHRANILNVHYTEIGVAVRKGIFERQSTWIAVQIFGRPASDCPAPNADLKTAIDAGQVQLNQMERDLAARKAAIDAADPKLGSQYDAEVQQYNSLVAEYNALVGQVKAQIDEYNSEAAKFNQCVGA